ncbi:DUF222 domain-containing protein [Arthrobacter sp. D1-17]
MDKAAVAGTLEDIAASLAALADVVRRGGFAASASASTSTSVGVGVGVGVGDAAADGSAGEAASADPDPLTSRDPLRSLADACLDGLAGLAGVEARMAALKVHFTDGYAAAAEALAVGAGSAQECRAREMAVRAEVACALTVSERSADALLGEARTLVRGLPLTLAALGAGSISWQHARILCDETANLDPVAAAALEAHFLEPYFPGPSAPDAPDAPVGGRGCLAGDVVPGRFRARARAWRERHHPVSIETRHRRTARDRRVEYLPDRDGMAWLSAYLPADTAAGIWNRTSAAARGLQGPKEPRTLAQLRADLAAGWLLAGTADGIPAPKAQVLVTVPVLSLLGAGEEPAVLDGYGPVPASMARKLTAEGATSFLRVLTDPRDGAPLEIGRTGYRLTTPMRQWLRLRDARCSFPGCNNHSLDNEADHVLAWSNGGGTGVSNLGQACPRHHRLKHSSAWRPLNAARDSPPGWISPAGRYYPCEQQDREPPHWPDALWPDPLRPDNPVAPDSIEDPVYPGWLDIEEPGSPPWPDDPGWPQALEPDRSAWPDNGGWPQVPEPDNLEGLDPPPPVDLLPRDLLPGNPEPVDPFPDWAHFTAA